MSIYRKGEYWYLQYRLHGKQIRISLHTKSKKAAKAKLKNFKKRLSQEQLIVPATSPPSSIAVADAIAAYKNDLLNRRAHKSAMTDIGRLMIMFQVLDIERLSDFSVPGVIAYFEKAIAKGRAKNTLNKYRIVLHSFFEFARRRFDYISPYPSYPNPIKKIQPYSVGLPVISYLSMEEIDKQLKSLECDPGMQAAVATMIYAGLRRSEVIWLTKDDVWLDHLKQNGLIRICAKQIGNEWWQPKTRKARSIPISYALFRYLSGQVKSGPQNCPWVFTSPQGYRWDSDNFGHHLQHLQKKAGLAWGCNDFRHTFATQMANSGQPLFTIAKLMGNSVAICERHYAAFIQDVSGDAVNFDTRKQCVSNLL